MTVEIKFVEHIARPGDKVGVKKPKEKEVESQQQEQVKPTIKFAKTSEKK